MSRVDLPEHFAVSAPSVPWLSTVREFIASPDVHGLRETLLSEFHASPAGGHSGVKATLARLSAQLYWPHMHAQVKDWVRKCITCQQQKYIT
ncbi:integrase zinc binding domain-containing protein, partial [Acinetobacter baumannii]